MMSTDDHENVDNVIFDKGVPLLRFLGQTSTATIYKQWNFYMQNYAIERGLPLKADDEGANHQENQRKLFAAIRKAVPPSAQDIVSHIDPTTPLCGSLVWAALADYYDANGAHDIGGMIDEFHKKQHPEESCLEFLNKKVVLLDRLKLAGMGESFPPKLLRIAVIRGLNEKYRHVTTLLDENDESCDIKKIRQILLQHGVRAEKAISREGLPSPALITGSAMAAVGAAIGGAVRQPTIADLLNKIAALEKKIDGGKRAFTGTCHKCHQYGHKARDCPANNYGVAAAAVGRAPGVAAAAFGSADGQGIPLNF